MCFSLALVCISLVALRIFAQPTPEQENTLTPFSTDGCSMWIDGTADSPSLWRHCCVAHDKAYWIGGTQTQREQADKELLACVAEVGNKGMANYMYFFVIPGGSPYWLTPYRWGYGWSYLELGKPRGYKTPTEAELIQINALLPQAEAVIAEDAAAHPVVPSMPEKK